LADPFSLKPANLLESLPKLGRLVNVNLASLLCVCLTELLASSQALEASLENSALACKVGGAVKSEVASQPDFIRVQQVNVDIAAQVNWLALPIHL
jgi:hypothetical protein